MNEKKSLTTIGHPVPELPVVDVERAQQYYRDILGFEIGWLDPGKEIGSVSRGRMAIFFRRHRRHLRGVSIVRFEESRSHWRESHGV